MNTTPHPDDDPTTASAPNPAEASDDLDAIADLDPAEAVEPAEELARRLAVELDAASDSTPVAPEREELL